MKQVLWHTLVVATVTLCIDQVVGSPPNVPTVTDQQALVDSLMSTYTNLADQSVYLPTSNSYERSLGVIAFDEAAFDDWVTNGWFTLEESGFDFYPVTLTETGDTVRAFTIDDGNGLVLYGPATPSGYDPQEWSEEVYGDPPGWLDATELVIWYADRDPNRQRITARMLPLAQRAAWLDHLSNTYATASSGSNVVFNLPVDTNLLAFAATTDSAGTWQPWFYIPGSVLWVDVFGSADLLWPWTLVGSFAPQYTLQSIAAGTSFTNFYFLGSDGSIDSDGDGLSDGREILIFGTDPAASDSDLDGLTDGDEILNAGLDALLFDTDGDGLTDAFELANNLDGTDATGKDGAQGDPDGDGISNEDEQILDTDPQAADTIVPLGSSEADEVYKTRTATRSKFTGFSSYVPTNPPAYFLDLIVSETNLILTANSTTSGCENLSQSITDYTLSQVVDGGAMVVTGNASFTLTAQMWITNGWWTSPLSLAKQVSWTNSQAVEKICTLDLSYCGTTNYFCGVGREIGNPPQYEYGEYTLGWLASQYPNATKTLTNLNESWNAVVGCNVSSQSVVWALSQLYDTNMLDQYTTADLGEMADITWNTISWSTNIGHVVGTELCTEPGLSTNDLTGPVESLRALSTNEVQLTLREAKFRFEVPTQSGVVHQISWIEHFEPDATTNPGGSNQVLHAANVQFLGDGMTQYVGRAEDDGPSPGYPYATLVGDSKDDDFTIPPPPQSLGNGVVKLYIIKVEIVDAGGTSTDALAISKWPGAFFGPTPSFTNAFIESDPDRFRLRILNFPTGETDVPVFLSTDHIDSSTWDDGETEITCTQDPSGTYTSKTMILVSNDIDDDEIHTNTTGQISGSTDDNMDDRTHIARLDSIVKARFSLDGVEMLASAIVPKPKHVNIIVKILKDAGGTPVVDDIRMKELLNIAREVYSQVGIEVEWNSEWDWAVGANPVDLTNGLVVIDSARPSWLTEEAQGIIDTLGTPNSTNDIHIFMVPYPLRTVLNGDPARATALYLNSPIPIQQDYYYNAFVVDSSQGQNMNSPWTLAHELGHILGLYPTTHPADPWLLMTDTSPQNDDIANSKRLTSSDEVIIRQSHHAQ